MFIIALIICVWDLVFNLIKLKKQGDSEYVIPISRLIQTEQLNREKEHVIIFSKACPNLL